MGTTDIGRVGKYLMVFMFNETFLIIFPLTYLSFRSNLKNMKGPPIWLPIKTKPNTSTMVSIITVNNIFIVYITITIILLLS